MTRTACIVVAAACALPAGTSLAEQALAALQSASGDEPPEEWKPLLEPLMKMLNEGRPLDLRVLLDALSKLPRSQSPNTDQQVTGKTPRKASVQVHVIGPTVKLRNE